MSLFLERSEYTYNPENWPVVPFSLLKMSGVQGKFKTNYNLGFQHWQILGFGLGISEELRKSGIKRPTLVWVRRVSENNKSWDVEPIESESYYEHLSPLCYQLRKCSYFKKSCQHRDHQIVKHIFKYLDGTVIKDSDILSIIINKEPFFENDNVDEKIDIHIVKDIKGRHYYKYKCPCMKLTELIYPIECEGVTIALVMVGQLIEDVNLNEIEIAFNSNIASSCGNRCNKSCCVEASIIPKLEVNEINIVSEIVLKEIVNIQDDYRDQIYGECRRLMNRVLKELSNIQKEFTLYDPDAINDKNNGIKLLKKQEVFLRARNCFRKSLDILEGAFGVEQVRLYFDDNFLYECNSEGVFHHKWRDKPRGERRHEYMNITGDCGVGDLFYGFKGTLSNSCLSTEDILPNDPDWSLHIYENAVITDEIGEYKEADPIVFGIKYKGGETGKAKYLHIKGKEDEVLWHKYVLPQFAIFARSVMLSIYLHLNSDALNESRATIKHEMGQINIGIEGINEIFELRRKMVESRLKHINPEMDRYFKLFMRHCDFFANDSYGLFLRAKLISKIYGDNPKPNPQKGDVYHQCLSRWRFAFFANCRESDTQFYLELHKPVMKEVRIMQTDFDFLEHIMFNVIGNGIKHALRFSKISLTVDKEKEFHVFRIINYGDYLEPCENSDIGDLYKRGVRNQHKSSKLSKKDNVGMGMGLYIAKKLVNALGGYINNDCEIVSKYNLSLLDYFIDEIKGGGIGATDLSRVKQDELITEHEEKRKLIYDEIIAHFIGGREMEGVRKGLLEKIDIKELYEELTEPTYKVVFTIKIPKSVQEEVNDK
ncbi:MAG: ATP-binding protein [Firmicutes bacterium]|nr:ATP-binding protein [Bacillota bacterium]